MLAPTLKSAVLPLALFTLRASAYTLTFYSDTDCQTNPILTHSINSTQQMESSCEMIPSSLRDQIVSAYLELDNTDQFLNYGVTLYSDARCGVRGAQMPADTCADASFGAMSFVVTSSSTTFDFGTVDSVYYSPPAGAGDAAYIPSSSSSDDTIVADQVDLMSEIDSTGDVLSVDLNGAGLPVGTTDDDCTTVKEQVINVDNDYSGVADGRISEVATIDDQGNESYQKIEVDYAGDLTGPDAIMQGPVVESDPTTNDPWAPDVGLDGTGGIAAAIPRGGASAVAYGPATTSPRPSSAYF
ncbi:hypothetical protein Dda_9010 [Drechslerella dactyloides]|uniref:Uncharacterized protein n=1 Tax=Drechslerella dactyloides TaxID=74499 RepID=A0AAD6IPT4_DREDA|nr:hypothetical protein Dda_9010 [Drechslerella dactyloides]